MITLARECEDRQRFSRTKISPSEQISLIMTLFVWFRIILMRLYNGMTFRVLDPNYARIANRDFSTSLPSFPLSPGPDPHVAGPKADPRCGSL